MWIGLTGVICPASLKTVQLAFLRKRAWNDSLF